MRNGQNKRMRGRNRKGGHHQNPLSRVYESNGQDVKIRGTASHIAEKYLQLARDAQSSGDPIASENYYQHAEHYFRLIAAAQEQLRQSQPYYQQQPGGGGDMRGNSDDGYDDGEGDQPPMAGEPFAPREPQAFYPREQQNHQQFQPQHHQPPQQQPYQPRHQNAPQHHNNDGDVERLPSFITGGQPQNGQDGQQGGHNGQNGYDGSADRFPLHRRRRRHRGGPRDQMMDHGGDQSADHSAPGEGDGSAPGGSNTTDE